MVPKHTTLANMAREIAVDPNTFRTALRNASFPPRKLKHDREVEIGSEEYSAMRSVLVTLLRRDRHQNSRPQGS
jgi:hypothetical protein